MLNKLTSLGVEFNNEVVAALKAATRPIAVACSGGADSVAAATLAKELCPQPITLLHFNHALRGAASDGDEAFVKQLAAKLGVNFRSARWTNPSAKNEGEARTARMAFLHQWEHPIIVFGHHADDGVETLLMRLARGASVEGLTAPHPLSHVGRHTHVRPLIHARKAQIVEALTALSIPFRHDESNYGSDYLRNRIRNELLPLWQKIETRDVVAGIIAAQEGLRKLRPTVEPIEEEEEPEAIAPQTTVATTLPIGATLYLPFGASLTATRVAAPDLETLKADSDPLRTVWLADAPELLVRPWSAGERYTPLGAPGSRKVKEILNENCGHIPPAVRACWPVVCHTTGVAAWLPGARVTAEGALKAGALAAIKVSFTYGK